MYQYFEVFYQTVLAFGTILVLTILLGKQQIAEMTFFEYINGITFGSIAATLATDIDQNTGYHLFGLLLFGALTLLMSYLSLKSRRGRKLLMGDPVIIIKDGKIMEENMKRVRFNMSEVMQLLRKKSVFDVSQVQFAILENDGTISVMMKPEYQQATPKNIFKPSQPAQVPMELVVDGQVIYENLRKIGRSGKWLLEQIQKQKPVRSIRDVFYASLESDGQLFIDVREDHVNLNINQ
ncbi:DUF421 domain-containing protein [Paenactinomyces guangxiensis]|uniref:DUF421 domain-containing protein n=1 Tax=Paenactinomyces guangxiensis TaxID=1490290 RepID=A0A7W1WRY4_9BACL|nr:DUF421 domain-containing protein [Paenactinomyces guangxiensis]MBA4494965.1 DUF421 domain-containing protein [Paenactinomyces guangxiensis]MBH8592048.1 DUF421 domain-containing protein [Paenactinomyces guangxiensis]